MKFHNVRVVGYPAHMNWPASDAMLARLRASTRLAALVLLIFAMKIGAAAACVKHDFADLGFGTDSSHAVAVKVSPLDGGNEDSMKFKFGHAVCSHCGCHHAAAMVPVTQVVVVLVPQALPMRTSGLPPSTLQPLELRPPIA